MLDAAVDHPAKRVWGAAADSGKLSPEQWERLLAATADPRLREGLADMAMEQATSRASRARIGVERAPDPESRPPTTPDEIAAMASAVPDIDPSAVTHALWWVAALHDDAGAIRQPAASSNLWIRRSVARAPHLPSDVVDLLTHDQDRVVRLFLTESCGDAPADVLLDVWTWWPGSFSFPGRPRNHPNFPRHDLLRFAGDPRPRVRLLALDDPASTAALIERFSSDSDAAARSAAARDPRPSPESAVRLAGDADREVQRWAWRNPALPVELAVRLLLDQHSAEEAAQNPAIPAAVMHRMIALAAPQN